MNAVVRTANPLRGTVRLPGDKSISHRAATLAALAEGTSRVKNFLRAGVTQAMLDCLSTLGAVWTWEGDELVVQGCARSGFASTGAPLMCGNSATTIRLLAGALAGTPSWQNPSGGAEYILDGTPQLRRRPMRRLLEPLRQMGAGLRALDHSDCAPLAVVPSRLHGIMYSMPVASAQVKTAVLLAGLHAVGTTTVAEPSPSRDHTERFLRHLGVPVDQRANAVRVAGLEHPLPAFEFRIPGDISSAAFLMVAAAVVPGSEITLLDVGLNPRRTGLLDVLRRMGASIDVLDQSESGGEPVGTLRVRQAPLHAATVEGGEVVDMIDEFPVFAVAAAIAEGTTVVRQAAELRHKESDRIAVLTGELHKMGIAVDEHPDGFAITGPAVIKGARVDSHGDHRLAMALAVAGLIAAGRMDIAGEECVAESFPDFFETLRKLGAGVE